MLRFCIQYPPMVFSLVWFLVVCRWFCSLVKYKYLNNSLSQVLKHIPDALNYQLLTASHHELEEFFFWKFWRFGANFGDFFGILSNFEGKWGCEILKRPDSVSSKLPARFLKKLILPNCQKCQKQHFDRETFLIFFQILNFLKFCNFQFLNPTEFSFLDP